MFVYRWSRKVMSLSFDEATHKYALRGLAIPGMTEVLQANGIIDYSRVSQSVIEYAQNRGRAVHKATELFDKGTLDWATVDPAIVGYVLAWDKFCEEYNVEHVQIEYKVYSELLRCAGIIDRLSFVRQKFTLLDIKSGDYKDSGALQTAGYDLMAQERGKTTEQRMIVKLNSDGTYHLAPSDYFKRSDYEDVQALIRTYHVKKRLGKI
jgi:hypothetical protein